MSESRVPVRYLWFAAIVLVLGLLLTALATWIAAAGVGAESRRELMLIDGEIAAKLQTRLQAQAQLLRSGAALFGASREVDREEWQTFIADSRIERTLPGILGVGFAPAIGPEALAEHVAQMKAQGFAGYRVWPPGERPLYAPIVYLEPFSGRNLRALGYDMYSEPVRRAAMERARDRDLAALTGKVHLVQETERDVQAGTLMYVPVYRSGWPIGTVEERRAALAGWVYSPYRMDDLMRGILGEWEHDGGRHLRLAVYDGDTLAPESLLYDSRPPVSGGAEAHARGRVQRSIDFNGGRWTVTLTRIDPPGDPRVWLVGAGGTLTALLLAALVLALLAERNQARRTAAELAARRTAEAERERSLDQLRHQHAVVSGIGRIFREALASRGEGDLARVCLEVAQGLTGSRFGFIGDIDAETGRLKVCALSRGSTTTGTPAGPNRLSRPDTDAAGVPLVFEPLLSDAARPGGGSGNGTGERPPRDPTPGSTRDPAPDPSPDLEIRGLYARVLQDGETLLVNDPQSHPEGAVTPPGHPPLSAFLGVPLRQGYKTLGLIGLANRPGGYSTQDRESAEAVAGAVVQAFLSKRAEATLRESDRRKDDFLATLAHELRNPLAPLRNGLEILELAGTDPQASARARAMMERQLKHLVHLVDDLLDLSRISRGRIALRRERVALADVLGQAIDSVRPLLDARGHRLEVRIPDAPIVLDADPLRLGQVLANLLDNAVKYTDPGGHIALGAAVEGGEVEISVADNGIGIPPALRPYVFDMFIQDRTAEQGHSGLGIGLSVVQRLVAMHGGRVEARSPGRGQGSTFLVRLPLAEAPAQAASGETPVPARPAGETAAPAPGESLGEPAAGESLDEPAAADGPDRPRILVVDDNRDAADSLAIMLDVLGYRVSTAYGGLAALELAEAQRPAAVVLDLGMPAPDGCETARRIRAQPWGAHMVLIALTGWGQDEDRRRSREAGFDRHLVKPVEPGVLGELLAQL